MRVISKNPCNLRWYSREHSNTSFFDVGILWTGTIEQELQELWPLVDAVIIYVVSCQLWDYVAYLQQDKTLFSCPYYKSTIEQWIHFLQVIVLGLYMIFSFTWLSYITIQCEMLWKPYCTKIAMPNNVSTHNFIQVSTYNFIQVNT